MLYVHEIVDLQVPLFRAKGVNIDLWPPNCAQNQKSQYLRYRYRHSSHSDKFTIHCEHIYTTYYSLRLTTTQIAIEKNAAIIIATNVTTPLICIILRKGALAMESLVLNDCYNLVIWSALEKFYLRSWPWVRRISGQLRWSFIMHLSIKSPTIPLLNRWGALTRGLMIDTFPRVGHLTWPVKPMLAWSKSTNDLVAIGQWYSLP